MLAFRAQVTRVSDGGDAPKGWVRVSFNRAKSTSETEWIAWPSLAAGNGFGLYLEPGEGTRCLVFFDDDDELLEDPLIAFANWDEVSKAPEGQFRLQLPSGGVFEVNGNDHSVSRDDLVQAELKALRTSLYTLINAYNIHFHTGFGGSNPTVAQATSPSAVGETASASLKVRD